MRSKPAWSDPMWTRTGGIVADVRVVGVDGVAGRWLARGPGARPRTAAAARPGGVAARQRGPGVLAPAGRAGRGRGLRHRRTGRPAAARAPARRPEARALLGPGRAAASSPRRRRRPSAVARSPAGRGSRASRLEADAASRAAGAGGVSTQSWMLAARCSRWRTPCAASARRRPGRRGAPGDLVRRDGPPLPAGPPPGKRSAPGVAARRIDLLRRTLPALDVLGALADVPDGAGAAARSVPVDDALDALAAACSALRHAYGQAAGARSGRDRRCGPTARPPRARPSSWCDRASADAGRRQVRRRQVRRPVSRRRAPASGCA